MASITIVGHDPQWPARAAREAVAIVDACSGLIQRVEHIGSTAVPGLGAKPTIDLLGGASTLEDATRARVPLERLGYEYVPEYEKELPDRRYYRKGPEGARTWHLHVCVSGGLFWRRHLTFRDALRSDHALAVAYERLKRDLARRSGDDRAAYTRGKTDFIREAVERWMARAAETSAER
jgi:GrpB-like predicted nucleotidyltransferase (UPF0157 family)